MMFKVLLFGAVAVAVVLSQQGAEAKRRDQAKVDEALRQLKGDNNELYHGPEGRTKHDDHEFKTKKYEKMRRQGLLGHWGEYHGAGLSTGDYKPKPRRRKQQQLKKLDIHDFDDARLQDVAYEKPEEENKEETSTTTTTTTTTARSAPMSKYERKQLKKKQRKEEKLRRKAAEAAHLNSGSNMNIYEPSTEEKKKPASISKSDKRAAKTALKSEMHLALSKGMDPAKVLAHFSTENNDAGLPKSFFRKFVKKWSMRVKAGKPFKKAAVRKEKQVEEKDSWAKRQAAKEERKRLKKIRRSQMKKKSEAQP